MRPFHQALLVAAIVAAPSASVVHASGGGKAEAGPTGIPFKCSDGRLLRVVYGREGPAAKAELLFEGSDHYELSPAPAYEGLRFTAEAPTGRQLAWTTDGIEGALTSVAAGEAEEQEVARCRRSGWSGEDEHPAEAHADDHKADGEAH